MKSRSEILAVRDLRLLSPEDFSGRDMEPDELRHILETAGALWLHSGDVSKPHAILHSGLHSDGFVDVLRAIRFANVCYILAEQLAKKIRRFYDGRIDWVIGSDHAGVVLSQNVAIHLGAQHDFTEKGSEKTQVWKRFQIQPGEVVVQVEELMTTAATFNEVRACVRAGNKTPVTFAPVAGVLVHRSDVKRIEETDVIAFVHYDIRTFGSSDCTLCAKGSRVLLPKQNWAELTGKM